MMPTLSIGSSRTAVPRNVGMFVTGRATPSTMRGLKPAVYDDSTSGGWHNLWLVTISKTGGVKTSIYFRSRGYFKLRWLYPGGPRWLNSASPARTIHVT